MQFLQFLVLHWKLRMTHALTRVLHRLKQTIPQVLKQDIGILFGEALTNALMLLGCHITCRTILLTSLHVSTICMKVDVCLVIHVFSLFFPLNPVALDTCCDKHFHWEMESCIVRSDGVPVDSGTQGMTYHWVSLCFDRV